jgi:hypothetical protein
MIKPKTHFEQVPLEIVKEIVEKQSEVKIAPVAETAAIVLTLTKSKPRTSERHR